MRRTKRKHVIRIKDDKRESAQKSVPLERPITVFVNGERLLTILATPDKLKELAVGFLYSQAVIRDMNKLEQVVVDESKGFVWVEAEKDMPPTHWVDRTVITSGCGGGAMFLSQGAKGIKEVKSKLKVTAKEVSAMMRRVLYQAKLHKQAGGVHCSAVCDSQGIIALSEDIGRHNSADKVLGECLLSQVALANKIIVTTGRVSSEMVLKTARAQVPILVSHSGCTDLACEIGERYGVTIIGYVRGTTVNIYTCPERIK